MRSVVCIHPPWRELVGCEIDRNHENGAQEPIMLTLKLILYSNLYCTHVLSKDKAV